MAPTSSSVAITSDPACAHAQVILSRGSLARDQSLRSGAALRRKSLRERWTRLDRVLAREAGRAEGVVDLRPERDAAARSAAGDPDRPDADA